MYKYSIVISLNQTSLVNFTIIFASWLYTQQPLSVMRAMSSSPLVQALIPYLWTIKMIPVGRIAIVLIAVVSGVYYVESRMTNQML